MSMCYLQSPGSQINIKKIHTSVNFSYNLYIHLIEPKINYGVQNVSAKLHILLHNKIYSIYGIIYSSLLSLSSLSSFLEVTGFRICSLWPTSSSPALCLVLSPTCLGFVSGFNPVLFFRLVRILTPIGFGLSFV